MPDPSFRLMSRMTQTALSKSVWLLKASADENKMGTYACAGAGDRVPSVFPGHHRRLRTRFRSCKHDIPDLSRDKESEPSAPSVVNLLSASDVFLTVATTSAAFLTEIALFILIGMI